MKLTHVLLMASAITTLAACGQPQPSYDDDWVADKPTRVCKDKNGYRQSDDKCRRSGGSGASAFMWYYLGRNSYVPPVGSKFSPSTVGSARPVAGTTYYTAAPKAPASAVTRGGFGSSVSSKGGSFSSGS